MLAKSQPLSKLNLQTLVDQARGLCEQIERGQAVTPLSDAFRCMADDPASRPLPVAVLVLSSAAREAVAAWLASSTDDCSRYCVQVAEPDVLLGSAGAYQRFCADPHALLVVGTAGQALGSDELGLLANLLASFPLVWPLVVDAAAEAALSDGWLAQMASLATGLPIAPAQLAAWTGAAAAADGAAGPPLSGRLETFREPLTQQRRAGLLSGLVQKLVARVDHELKHLKGAVSRLETPAKSSPTRAAADSDKEFAPLRDRFGECVATIDRQMTLKSDRSTQPLGELSGMMRSISSSLNVEDLEKSRSTAMLKLSVNASHLARINRRIEHVLRQEFVNDLQQVERQALESAEEITADLEERFAASVPLKFPPLDVNHAWRSVENLMAVGKEAHIELARKGFFDVLTAGRQKVFIIIMFVSLMGRMGLPNLFSTPASKAGFGLFMAVVMVGSMINAVLNWRREKQLQSEKEMSKIRESLLVEGSKVIEQVEKAKLATMRDYFKELGRSFDGTVKQFIEEAVGQQRAKREAELQKQDALRKALEARTKQFAEMQRQAGKLADQAHMLLAATSAKIAELASGATLEKKAHPTEAPGQRTLGRQTPPAGAAVNATVNATVNSTINSAAEAVSAPPAAEPARPRAIGALAERRLKRSLAAQSLATTDAGQ